MKRKIKKLFHGLKNWKETKELLTWVFTIGKDFKKYIFGFLVINMLTMIISLVSAIAGRYVVDAATGFKSELFFRYIMIMLGTTVISIIISSLSSMFSNFVNEKFAFGIRADMFDRVQRSVWDKITKFHSGDMLARLSGDIETIASSIVSMLPNIIVTCCQLILVLIILVKNDPMLAVIGLIVGPIGLIASIIFRKKYSHYQKLLRESHSEYYSFLQECFSNIGVIKTFQLENRNNTVFKSFRNKRMKIVIKASIVGNVMSSLMKLVYSIGYVVTFSWCAYRLTTAVTYTDPSGAEVATYTYGMMTLFLSLVSQLQGSIKSLGHVVPQFYSLIVSAKRVREITDLEPEAYEEIDTMPQKVGLKVQDVCFSYDAEDRTILKDMSFIIPPNSRVGIIGTSGAGKTTFIRLLLSLVKPDSGTLEYIDGNGIKEKIAPSSRRFISYVPQGNTLLSGTIRSNMQAGRADATDEEMWNTLEIADAAGFVKKMPDKLDTPISEGSVGLSEGQAQRISIARALLRKVPVLILDEATSALDEKTEKRIFEQISLKKDCTCFIITHRRSMLKYCDLILEINDDGFATLTQNTQ